MGPDTEEAQQVLARAVERSKRFGTKVEATIAPRADIVRVRLIK